LSVVLTTSSRKKDVVQKPNNQPSVVAPSEEQLERRKQRLRSRKLRLTTAGHPPR
jgi:hypothetical protein